MIRQTRTPIRHLAMLAFLGVAGCVAAPPAPTPTPKPVEKTPPPATTPPPAPRIDNWMDAPQTPGDWSYRPLPSGGLAQFAQAGSRPAAWIQCDRAARTVTIYRTGTADTSLPVRIRTETAERVFSGTPVTANGQPAIAAALPAASSFLDAIAFSKGRFALEAAGMPALYLPSWPEITRVIEDCR